MNIVLASSSPYRKKQLETILSDFTCHSPDIDESKFKGELPDALAARLSMLKATEVAKNSNKTLVIGSDQVGWLDGQQLHKPGNAENNIKQLQACSGKTVTFYTGICLINSDNGNIQCDVAPFHVKFRNLSHEEITYYVNKEKPYDCAGGFKVEGLGISLFEALHGDDPNSLIGLPLIKLINMLKKEGLNVITAQPI